MTSKTRNRWTLAVTATLTTLFGWWLSLSFSLTVTAETPPEVREGWAGPEAVAETAEWSAAQPLFGIIDPVTGQAVMQANENANVRLWEDVARATTTPPQPGPQLIGDCTAWGARWAINTVAGSQIANGQADRKWRDIAPHFLYGVARVDILKNRVRGDGATGSSVARAAKEFGVLAAEDAPPYTGAIARDWGSRGVPAQYKQAAAANKVKTVSLMKTAADVRDAICNRYPVTIASDWGSDNASMQPRDGRIVAKRTGRWMHQMCIDGYDGRLATKYYHVQNSWGSNAHPAPIDGSPAGGFWITEADVTYIVGWNDSWAYSDFDGFPAFKFDVFGAQPPQEVFEAKQ